MSNQFPSTRWSFILDRPPDVEAQRRAADELCRLYWQPVYAFVRRSLVEESSGAGHETAADLTQGFFAAALQGGLFDNASPEKGRLRSYVLGAVKKFVASERRRERAQKRGGEIIFLHIDAGHEERTRYSGSIALASDGLPPDQWFDRRWAEGLLETGLRRLREEYSAKGKEAVYEVLKVFLTADDHDSSSLQEQAMTELHCRPGALRVAIHRFRRRYRELVREEVRATLLTGDEIEDELAWLAKVLAAKE